MIWLTPYFIIRFAQFKFLKIYVNLLYVFSIIGLFFWLIVNLSPDIYRSLLKLVQIIGTDPESGESFILYNLDHHRPTDIFFMKNPGPFNEGGTYVCYLIVALILNSISTNQIWNNKNNVFILSNTHYHINCRLPCLICFYWRILLIKQKPGIKISRLSISSVSFHICLSKTSVFKRKNRKTVY